MPMGLGGGFYLLEEGLGYGVLGGMGEKKVQASHARYARER